MCINKNCCIPRVAINGYTIGTAFAMNTVYDFSNSENCDKFLLILQADIPSQITIVPVNLVTTTGTITTLPLRNSLGNNIMSDQLVGVHSLCVVFGNNTTHLKVLKAFNRCGAEIRLRKSAFYETEEVIEEPEI